MDKNQESKDLFQRMRDDLLKLDPVFWCQKYLTLDGKPFRIHGNGYKPFADMYRYIGVKALEPDSKPVVLVKGRQCAGTTMAAALELYFMCSGLFGGINKSPIRVIHAFPQREMAEKFSKEKLNPMINSSISSTNQDAQDKKRGTTKSHIQAMLDMTSETNNSLGFKQFLGGNFLRIDSTGLVGDRMRGGTGDVMFYDECFPREQYIETEGGKQTIGTLYDDFIAKKLLPRVKTFNEITEEFEYKEIINAWKRDKKHLIQITCGNKEIKCTPNHKFLTDDGWVAANQLRPGTLLKTSNGTTQSTKYKWDNKFKSYGLTVVDKITPLDQPKEVYDIEIQDNHNFILAPCRASKNGGGPIVHNCQDIPGEAIGNTVEMLKQAKYGRIPGGVQVYFGTPKRKGSDFYKMWMVSSQQYYYLGCEKCYQHFPLYTPESDEWQKIWLHGFIVKCTHCGHEQDKRTAAERGKWVSTKDVNDADCRYIGFHINQFYMPNIQREDIDAEQPGNHPTNTMRKFQNEVLGEFFQGDSSPITTEEIIKACGVEGKKMRARINPGEEKMVLLGIDYGLRRDMEQLANPNRQTTQGQSYTTAVVLSVQGPNLFSVELALKFNRNDPEGKKGIIDNIMRQYSVDLAIGDIGYSNDLSQDLQRTYGSKYLVSRVSGRMKSDKQIFNQEVFPKEIVFEKDYYIGEMMELLKKGQIKFPLGSYDHIAWLIDHCASMELKPSISRYGDPEIHYVKGSTPNDGLMGMLNAYIAYRFLLTNGFTIKNPNLMTITPNHEKKPLIVIGHIKRRL